MDVMRKAEAFPDVIHFEVGEPDVPPSPKVLEALHRAVDSGSFRYTNSLGIGPLRERIAEFYREKYGVEIPSERVVVTCGTSGAFIVAYSLLLDAGDKILLTDPSYPCYKNIAHFLNVDPVFVPIDKTTEYQLVPEALERSLADHRGIKAIHIPSPSNPLGNMYSGQNLGRLIELCSRRGLAFISDEIYHGLVYEGKEHTALEYDDDVIVINGFSKWFSMAGLRIGWMILPQRLVRQAEMVLQNTSISVSILSQHAGMAAFDWPYLEKVRDIFKDRRDYLYAELSSLFDIDAKPEGAFYIWADISRYSDDCLRFAETLLDKIHIAVTPGVDFGQNGTNRYIRFSYTREKDHLREGVERLKGYLASLRRKGT
jgi:aspartate/methionine/tyrosine aminotransferase